MDYILICLVLFFVVGLIIKPFIPSDSQDSKVSRKANSANGFLASRPLHSSTDCLSAEDERALLESDGALNRLRLKHVQRAPNGDRLESALYLTLDGRLINPESRTLYRYGIYVAPVRGVSYRPESVIVNADTRPGKRAILEREPNNEHDSNAIIIRDALTHGNIGYVNKLNAKRIAKLLDSNPDSLQAVFIRGSRPGYNDSPMRVLIALPDRIRTLLS